jgi:hypothetical protein
MTGRGDGIPANVGAGLAIENRLAVLVRVPALGAETLTVTFAVPTTSTSVAGIAALSSDELTHVVVRGDPFQLTTADRMKFEPRTWRLRPPVPN